MIHSLHFLSFVGLLGLLVTGHSRAQIGPNATAQAGAPVAPAAIAPDSVYVNPEVRPQFTGGDKAFISYLSKSIRYPQQALQRHVSGKVYVILSSVPRAGCRTYMW